MMERRHIDDSIDMAKEAVQEGMTTIIATPHHKNNQYENEKLDILDKGITVK